MKDENCIFCKILAGEIPSTAVYPAARGHVIVLPKNHAANIYELPDEDASKIMIVAKKIATAIEKAYHCDGVNILQNNGEAAGQTVFHLHVHVIPRFKGDTVNIGWKQGDMPEDLDAICKEIQAQL